MPGKQASFPIHRRYLKYSYLLPEVSYKTDTDTSFCLRFFSDYGLPAITLLSFIKLLEKRNEESKSV